MRVASWNLRGLRDLRAAHDVLADLLPDVALLQESGRPDEIRDLARSLGMEALGTPRPVLRRPVRNTVLVRASLEVRSTRFERLRGTGLREPRGALVVDAVRGTTPVRLIAAHLGLDARERVGHARSLAALLDARSILGVDVNASPDSVAARTLAGAGVDALSGVAQDATFPADEPRAAIDRIVVGRAWTVARAWVLGGDRADLVATIVRASDHRPVAAELLLDSSA